MSDEITLAVMPRARTRALVDGRVQVPGVSFIDDIMSHERHLMILSSELAGGEMSTSGLVRSHMEQSGLAALPVFIKRGFMHVNIIVREDSPLDSPEQLAGCRVGVDHYESSIMVWVRGLFAAQYGISADRFTWVTTGDLHPAMEGLPVEQIAVPSEVQNPAGWVGMERVDGQQRRLRPEEIHVLSLLGSGELDAVLSTTTPTGPGLRLLFPDIVAAERSWYDLTGVYPVNHTVVLARSVLQKRPDMYGALTDAFRQARALAGPDQPTLEQEKEIIGHDPFSYECGERELKVLSQFIGFLHDQKFIPSTFPAEELFDIPR